MLRRSLFLCDNFNLFETGISESKVDVYLAVSNHLRVEGEHHGAEVAGNRVSQVEVRLNIKTSYFASNMPGRGAPVTLDKSV